MKKKKLLGITIAVVILALGFGIYKMGQLLNEPTDEEIDKAKAEIEKGFKATELELIETDGKVIDDVTVRFPDNMKESEMQNAIHGLSHQKVEAKTKWGYIQMTEERINRLFEVAKLNEQKWELNGDLYVDILAQWSSGDFSKVDIDHNDIWELQGGSVGRATGLLNPWEEKQYIENTFE